MTGFSAEWLALREPADTRARDRELTAQLAQLVCGRSPIRFIDLACGTGANLRYLAPRVGGEQEWLLVDDDRALLDRAACEARKGAGSLTEVATGTSRCRVETRCLDLETHLRALDLAPDVVVTASALLDLVSGRWLEQLVDRCCSNRCAAYFALSYDGRMALTPVDPDDEWIRALVNRHQLGDKGFGPALGPDASRRAGELFREAGYRVRAARSDWSLLASERLLQQLLIEGWAGAAMELAPKESSRCQLWLARRLAHVAQGTSRIVVGHEDLLVQPAE